MYSYRDLGALQVDGGDQLARNVARQAPVGQGEDALEGPGVGKVGRLLLGQIVANPCRRQIELIAQGAHRRLGVAHRGAGAAAFVAQQVAVEHQGAPTEARHRRLEAGVAAAVLAGVEVGETVARVWVGGRIVEQVGDGLLKIRLDWLSIDNEHQDEKARF